MPGIPPPFPTPIMIQGCTSDAGKSFLVAALCRHFSNRGLRVAPFKAQNMSNNAAVTREGLEMGRAQYFQALAARAEPEVRMNPVLLKPSSDTASQVIVMGKPDPKISAVPWMERRARLWPVVTGALHGLISSFDRVIIEGAGSPAEINLRAGDVVNMAVALECRADVYIVVDIDHGGAFAHLLGTWHCLQPDERARVRGFILNKFRGDQKLLGNAMDWLRTQTGIPTVAVIPMIPNTLPEEDTLHLRAKPLRKKINIALTAYPYASNLDEFDALVNEPSVQVVPVRDLVPLEDFHAIILPGSKNTAESLRYLRESGLGAEIVRAARQGISLLGICGGMQMLGHWISDPAHLEGGDLPGLGLLDLTTTLDVEKTTRRTETGWVDGGTVSGYEIHHGRTEAGPDAHVHLKNNLGWRQENVCGVCLHGLMENTAYRQHFLSRLGWKGKAKDWNLRLDAEIERVTRKIAETGWFEKL